MGWDFFVEFEPDELPGVPHDMRPGMKKALVQIKSTDSRQTSVAAKLSALKRLVDTDLPAFILHMEFDNEQHPTRLRLLHIDRNEIESVQRAVRQTEHLGHVNFNRVNHRLSLDHAKILALDGSDAGDAIYEVIPEEPHKYGIAKSEFRSTCGFDEKSIMGGFNLATGLTERDLAHLLVGRTPKLELSKFVVQRSRFGLSLAGDRLEWEEGELSVEIEPFQFGKLTVTAAGGIKRATLPVSVYGSGSADLAPEHQLLRLSSEFIDWLIYVNTGEDEFSIRIENEKQYSINDLARVMSFALLLREKGASVSMEIGGQSTAKYTTRDELKLNADWELLTEFCSFLAGACSREWSDEPIKISLRGLFKALKDNAHMYAAATRRGSKFVFSSDGPISVPDGTEGYIYLPICIEFCDLVYSAIVKADAPPLAAGNKVSFVGAKPEIVVETIAPRHDGLHEDLNSQIDRLAREASRPGIWTVTAKVARSDAGASADKPARKVNPSRRPVLPRPKRGKRRGQ